MRIRKAQRNANASTGVSVRSDDAEPDDVRSVEAAKQQPPQQQQQQQPLRKESKAVANGRPRSTSTSSTPVAAASRLQKPFRTLQESLEDEDDDDEPMEFLDQVWPYGEDEDPSRRHYVRRSQGGPRKEGHPDPDPDADAGAPLLAQSQPDSTPTLTGRAHPLEVGEEVEQVKRTMPPPTSSKAEADNRPHHPRQNGAYLSTAPEGSLAHTLYLQLVAAGSEGITLRELLASFKKQTALPDFGSDWKEQVRAHLRSNSHIDEVKGHFVLCDQLVKRPKRCPAASPAAPAPRHPYMRTTNTSGRLVPPRRIIRSASATATPAPAPAPAILPTLPVEKLEGVQTRRKAYDRTFETVLRESAKEFERIQRMRENGNNNGNNGNNGNSLSESVHTTSDLHLAKGEPSVAHLSKKRKSAEMEDADGNKTIRGCLQALQAKIVAETGAQAGVPCARKDDARRWHCPLMAMEGQSLCTHHKDLQARKRARKQEETMSSPSARGRSSNRRLKADLVKNSDTDTDTEMDMDMDTDMEMEMRMSSPEKEDVAASLGGGHVIEALMGLQGQQTATTTTTTPLKQFEPEAEAAMEDHAPDPRADNNNNNNNNNNADADEESPSSSDTKTEPADDAVLKDFYFAKATPGSLKALQAKFVAENGGVNQGVRCARKDGNNDSTRKWQCPLNAMEGHTLCQHHNYLKERKRARCADAKHVKAKAAAAGGSGAGAGAGGGSRRNKAPSASIRRLNVSSSPPEEVQVQAGSQDEKSDPQSPELPDEGTPTEPAKGTNSTEAQVEVEAQVEAEPLQTPKEPKEPKRWYVAAKKTAANVEGVKEKSQDREPSSLIRSPTVPPLQPYGVRRKAVKNRSLLSL